MSDEPIDTGGPAFPSNDPHGMHRRSGLNPPSWHENGMTLRDYFAIHAPKQTPEDHEEVDWLSEARRCGDALGTTPPGNGATRGEWLRFWAEADAKLRYIHADAMLRAQRRRCDVTKKKLTTLTDAQRATFPAQVAKWTAIGLSCEPVDHAATREAITRLYAVAKLPVPPRIVYVPSPLAGAFAASIAEGIWREQRKGNGGAVYGAVYGAVNGAVDDAVDRAVDRAVGGAVYGAVDRAVNGAVDGAVNGAVRGAVYGAVERAVYGAVNGAVRGAVYGAVDGAVRGAVYGAVDRAVYGAVYGAVGVAVNGAVNGAVRGAVYGAVDDAVDRAVDRAVGDAVGVAVNGAVNGAVRGAVYGAVYDAVGGAVYGAVDRAVYGAVYGAVNGAVRGAVYGAVDDAVGGAVGDAVGGAVYGSVGGAVYDAVSHANLSGWHYWYAGSMWAGFAAWYSTIVDLAPNARCEAGDAYVQSVTSGGYLWLNRDFAIYCDRPSQIHRDDQGRLHCETGPSIAWRDGYALWHIDGVRVTQQVAEHPETLTIAQIQSEKNAEVRRIMRERFGEGRYLRETGAQVLDVDYEGAKVGACPRALMVDHEKRRFLVGTDGSTGRVYYMRVPDNVKTCRAAHEALCGFDETRIVSKS